MLSDYSTHHAVVVGQAANPGPESLLRLVNGRGGGRLKVDTHAAMDSDITVFAELELLESST